MVLDNLRTLVLNGDYRPLSYAPLSTVSWRKSVKMLLTDKCSVLDSYDMSVRYETSEVQIPSVILLNKFVHLNFSEPSALTRYHVYLRDEYTCQYCGEVYSYDLLTFDHVIPVSRGGITSWLNIVTCCKQCNHKKANKVKGVPRPLREPYVPSKYVINHKAKKLMNSDNLYSSWIEFI